MFPTLEIQVYLLITLNVKLINDSQMMIERGTQVYLSIQRLRSHDHQKIAQLDNREILCQKIPLEL